MKRLALVAASVAFAVALAGCAHPFIPATVLANAHKTTAKSVKPLLGVDVYGAADYPAAATTIYGSRVLPYLGTGLKAQAVGLMWNICTASNHSNSVHACKSDSEAGTGTMSPADIRILARMARKDGLQVEMRPIIRVGPPSGWNDPQHSWEGYIVPTSYGKWFKSLLRAELPYLKIAKSVGVEQFVVATELSRLTYTPWWSWFLDKAQSDCHCQVSYAAQYGQYLDNWQYLPPVEAFGTDPYPVLHLRYTASQEAVTKGWEKSLASVPEQKLKRTSLDEVSIRATRGAYTNPSAWDRAGASDPTVQVRYFTAACDTVAHYHMQALFYYFVPLADNPASPVQFPAYFVGTPGGAAIAACRDVLKHADG
jgi:hypothetical protein